MRVKTFSTGLANGYDPAFNRLDNLVKELGEDIIIHSLRDYSYDAYGAPAGKVSPNMDSHITRVVVYSLPNEKKLEGKAQMVLLQFPNF